MRDYLLEHEVYSEMTETLILHKNFDIKHFKGLKYTHYMLSKMQKGLLIKPCLTDSDHFSCVFDKGVEAYVIYDIPSELVKKTVKSLLEDIRLDRLEQVATFKTDVHYLVSKNAQEKRELNSLVKGLSKNAKCVAVETTETEGIQQEQEQEEFIEKPTVQEVVEELKHHEEEVIQEIIETTQEVIQEENTESKDINACLLYYNKVIGMPTRFTTIPSSVYKESLQPISNIEANDTSSYAYAILNKTGKLLQVAVKIKEITEEHIVFERTYPQISMTLLPQKHYTLTYKQIIDSLVTFMEYDIKTGSLSKKMPVSLDELEQGIEELKQLETVTFDNIKHLNVGVIVSCIPKTYYETFVQKLKAKKA